MLVRRFENVRRRHPLQGRRAGRLADGIAAERELLARCAAKRTWSSTPSALTVHQLRATLERAFGNDRHPHRG